MTGLEIIREVRDILTAGAAIVAGIKAWLADEKAKRIEKDVADIKVTLAQQQLQKQSQNITVNVGTSAGSEKKEATLTLSSEEPE